MIERFDTDRSVDLVSEPIKGMKIQARVLRHQNFGIHVRFDGTPADDFIRPSEVAAWINALKAMLDQAKEISFELKQGEREPKEKKRRKK